MTMAVSLPFSAVVIIVAVLAIAFATMVIVIVLSSTVSSTMVVIVILAATIPTTAVVVIIIFPAATGVIIVVAVTVATTGIVVVILAATIATTTVVIIVVLASSTISPALIVIVTITMTVAVAVTWLSGWFVTMASAPWDLAFLNPVSFPHVDEFLPIPPFLPIIMVYAFRRLIGRWRGRRRQINQDLGDIVLVVAFVQDSVRIADDAQNVRAGGNSGYVEPLAIEAFVVNIFPADRQPLVIAGVFALSRPIRKGARVVAETETLFSDSDHRLAVGIQQFIRGHAVHMIMSMAGADMEKVGALGRIPDDQVAVAGIGDPDIKEEQASSPCQGAPFHHSTVGAGKGPCLDSHIALKAVLIDDEVWRGS
jgi:hypothetical protein